MINTIKAEIFKVITIRSTYIYLGIIFILVAFFGFYVSGWKVDSSDLHNPTTLVGDIYGAISVVSIFVGLVAVLLMAHEYRFNTILHTLTLSNSRAKVLLSKVIVVTGLSVIATVFIGILSPLLAIWGMHAHNLHLVHQNIPYFNTIWRSLFYGWGYSMIALLIAILIRNQIGAIVTLLVVPGTIEGLISLIIKQNVNYLPFDALKTVIGEGQYQGSVSSGRAALVFTAYIIGGGIIGWVLFLRRDAS